MLLLANARFHHLLLDDALVQYLLLVVGALFHYLLLDDALVHHLLRLMRSYRRFDTAESAVKVAHKDIVLLFSVIKPTIDLLCDPDVINETLYNWLDYRERLAREHKRTYSYAATYEQFMDIIEKCSDLEHLKQLRYNIITEIVHATAIQHFKRQKGEDTGTSQLMS